MALATGLGPQADRPPETISGDFSKGRKETGIVLQRFWLRSETKELSVD